MKSNKIDLSGIFPALVESDKESADFSRAFDKFSGLVIDLLEEASRGGVFKAFKKAKVLIGSSSEWLPAGKGDPSREILLSLYIKEEEEALHLIASDIIMRGIQTFQHLQAQHEWTKLTDIAANLPTYFKKEYFQKIAAGKITLSDIKYLYPRISNTYEEAQNGNEEQDNCGLSYTKQMASCVLFGQKETIAGVMFADKLREFLDRIMDAVSRAVKILRDTCLESFNYLIALIEASLVARDKQCMKPPSKKTAEVQRDMGAIFINTLNELGVYDKYRYALVFSAGYNPFRGVGTSSKNRHDYKKKLLNIFRALLQKELRITLADIKKNLTDLSQTARCGGEKHRHAAKQSFLEDINTLVDSICDWIESIGYRKANYQKADL